MHLVRAVFNEEIFQLYLKYESAVHGRERNEVEFRAYYCNSTLYDERHEPEKAKAPMVGQQSLIDGVWHRDDGN